MDSRVAGSIHLPFPISVIQFKMSFTTISSDALAVLLENDKNEAGETQLQRYERLGAPQPILDMIRRGGGPAMGTQAERIVRSYFPCLLPRLSKKASGTHNSGYDHRSQCMISDEWKLLEQKTSGLWSDAENDHCWQHIEKDHPWNGLLLAGIGVDSIRMWGMTRSDFEACVLDGRATNQGNKEKNSSEGVWMLYRNVRDCLTPLSNESDVQAFVATL